MSKHIIMIGLISLAFSSRLRGQEVRNVPPEDCGRVCQDTQQVTELDLAWAAAGTGSAADMRGRLFTINIPVLTAEFRAKALADLPNDVRAHRINRGSLFRRAELILRQVAELQDRSGMTGVELFLYHDSVPAGYLWRGCIMVLSDDLSNPLSDAELTGIVAHELGHAYFMDDAVAAKRSKQSSALRVVELKCDAVAIVSLKLLGHDPASFLRALQKIQLLLTRKKLSPRDPKSHPGLSERALFLQRLIQAMAS
jgi:Zn-dependent protease with chaperone function